MATKKTAVIPEEEILAAATEENINEHALHQTETEPEPDRVLSAEGAPGDADLIDICQTDSESANPEGMPIEDAARNTPEAPVSQTGSGTELPGEFPAGSDELTAPEAPVSQTDSDLEEKKPEESPPARRTRKPRAKKSESDTTAAEPPGDASDGVESPEKKPRRRAAARPASPVVSIDERPSVETEADKARNDLLDLVESLKTKRILTGTIQGIERPADHPSRSLAVIYHGDIKVIIPAEEAVEPPEDFRGRLPEDVLHYMVTKRLGAEVDYIIKGIQDVVTYGENVSDPVSAYLRLEMEALGTMHLVKTSEDGVVANISFTISGNGITKTVTTGRDGTIDVSELMAGTYTVTEADIERYTPQTSQQVTIVGGQTSTVTFNNVLKRGALEVTKTSEDGFVEGVKFRLYGKSLSGLNVDEYAVTDSTGVAKFRNVLIGGPYTIEEVDTAIRYVIPDPQSVSIQWNRVAERSFANILKKFTVTVTKTDAETGTPQGDATLSGAKYGIYKGGKLVDVYYTDAKGQFTSKEYICDTDWTIREMEPSEGYLLDTTEHTVGAAPGQYTVEHNTTANAVTETVIKGSIRLIKHIDAELETSENAPTPQAEAEIPAATDPSAPEGSAYFTSLAIRSIRCRLTTPGKTRSLSS